MRQSPLTQQRSSLFPAEHIHDLYNQKYAERRQQECDNCIQKAADGNKRMIAPWDRDSQRREVDAGKHCADNRHQNVIYQRVYDGCECRTDDQADRHVQYISLGNKLLELTDYAFQALSGFLQSLFRWFLFIFHDRSPFPIYSAALVSVAVSVSAAALSSGVVAAAASPL